MQIFAIVVSLAIAAVGIALFVRAIREIIATIRIGGPARRTDQPGARTATMLKETLGHTRMLQWTLVGAAHWFVFIGFGLLFFTLVTAFGQLFDPAFTIPLLGRFFLYEWLSELVTVVMLVAIIGFIAYRATRPRERVHGVPGRFFGSTMWQGYFVEFVILGVGLCIMILRGLEYALIRNGHEPAHATVAHFPLTFWLGEAFSGLSLGTVENLIYLVAMVKIVISFAWMITISLNTTMGVAWHRFTVFFNIFFRREPSGRTALGAAKPLTVDGKQVTLDDIDDLDEDATLGVGAVEDFSWKGILDFTTCTECGRCQSQCPAWNTDKPLSPKLLITALRDHAYAKAPYLQAAEGDRAALLEGSDTLVREVERPLVADTGDDWFYMPDNGSAVIDPDVLWSCTTCGACVQQCPVDIEHVDHILDMRRYQVLVESNFPAELNQLFRGLENKGNPWNMSASARLDWAKGLDFDIRVVGETIESLDEVDWLFWVGCAGAYEDRAKKTTRAVAELLHTAGVSFGVLGNGETCTGDPARRAGNEFVFQGLAQQNVETFKEYKVKQVVTTCAHCFNTLRNEYKDFGIELEVVHHTQLLNRLVRDGRLTPVGDGAGAHKRSITYHDPCYIGRHNGVYSPPRELLQVLPGAEYREMERNSERSFCCGAGGARMWMEENLGERINVNRTKEAVGTGADQIATGCPFCRVMLSDGLTAQQAKGEAREEVEVLDVAQMLLASVKGEVATKLRPGEGAAVPAAARPAETKAEPEPDDVTQTPDTVTATEDAGPAAKASGGTSLFDTPAESASATGEKPAREEAAAAKQAGGSLFDLGADGATKPEATPTRAPEQKSGGSLFDVGADDAPATEPAPTSQTHAQPGSGGSLFDIPAEEPAQSPASAQPKASQPDLGSGGSLFDVPAAEPAPAAETTEPETAGTATGDTPSATVPESGSLFDIPAPEREAPAVEQPAPASVTETPETDAPVQDSRPAPTGTIPEGGSLFDIAAPEPQTAATDQPEASTPASGEAVSQAATEASRAAGEAEPTTDRGPEAEQVEEVEEADEPEQPQESEQPVQSEPEPADEDSSPETESERRSSASTHQPRTDAEINEFRSLFDL